ncbi:MAG: PPC domain-containing DNA-binding protein [bacterium]|jgi:predicted DNA-binding protein with PD1-like motif
MSDSLLVSWGTAPVQKIVQFRVKPDSDLLTAIEEAVKKAGIKSGVIVSGLGALSKAVFRNLKEFPSFFPVVPENRLYLDIEAPLELVSLTGWIAPQEDGEPEIHAHFAASVVDGDTVRTYGGHLTKGTTAWIKVVVAIAVIEEESAIATHDPFTESLDLKMVEG